MQVISLCSQKGGSGKTTLTGHLAVQAALQGHGPVALIDCDPQGSLAAWWNSREAAQPAFLETTLATLGADLQRLREQGFRYVFIDTPPAVSMPILRVMEQSDLVVIPTRPSPHDLRAVRATLDLAERAGKPLIFVVNGAAARARITSDAAVALSQHGTVAPSFICHRIALASSMIDGRTVMEIDPEHRASGEVVALWSYLEDRLVRLANRMAFHRQRPTARSFGRRSEDDGLSAPLELAEEAVA
jgi:chromosome partitioning protein